MLKLLIVYRLVFFVLALVFTTSAMATLSIIKFSNNSVTSSGYLLDDSAGFLNPDIPGGKLIAR